MSLLLLVSPSKTARALLAANVVRPADTVVGVATLREAIDTIVLLTPDVIIVDPEAGQSPEESRRLAEACAGTKTTVLSVVTPPIDAHAGTGASPDAPAEARPPVVTLGPVTLHRDEFRVHGPAGSAYLTAMEMRLLDRLIERRGAMVSSAELLQHVWGHENGAGAPTVVRAHIRNLRAKLRRVSPGTEIIRTFPRRGYTVVGEPQPPLPPIFARELPSSANGRMAITH